MAQIATLLVSLPKNMLYDGKNIKVYFLEVGKDLPVDQFLTNCQANDQRKILVTIHQLDERFPTFSNRTKYKKLEGTNGLFELKNHQIRIGCFWDSHCLILAHAFIKKSNKWPKRELEVLKSRYCAYLKQQKNRGA